MSEVKLSVGSGTSITVDKCQICGSSKLRSTLFLGYLPPVNQMRTIGDRPFEQPAYPTELLCCSECELVQLGTIVDPEVLFACDYPYTSGSTRILHQNFSELQEESTRLLSLTEDDLIVDFGSNDGTLLSKYKEAGFTVLGIEPTDQGKLAIERGIPTEISFFTKQTAERIAEEKGKATVITAANCFAHIENVHEIVEGVLALLEDDGVFISESHYLMSLLDTVQYDTIYHEHLRYYSLQSLAFLFESHGLEIIHAKPIPSHGGSIRVYAARKGTRDVLSTVNEMLDAEKSRGNIFDQLDKFALQVSKSKLELYRILAEIKSTGGRVVGVSAPSRASTLISYVGLDDTLIDYVVEISSSHKVGKYMPGTLIPVVDEEVMFTDQPEYALMLSWHIAEELIPKLKAKGFKGKFIVPLPEPSIY
ncbi:class I SAM-dependent methyltransferase [Porticoccaceae bacterium]|nr:class I SAM-dependent methyltransferase [Porticoccaceae bacterium]